MNWNETFLSTQETLTRHEKEIILQAGHDIVWAIETPEDCAVTVQGEYPNGGTIKLFYIDGSIEIIDFRYEEATLPRGKTIIRILLNNIVFPLMEGSGFELYPEGSTNNSEVLTMHCGEESFASGWRQVETNLTWQAKIDLAKTILGNAVEDALIQRGVTVNESAGESVLDLITNPEVLTIACDYLALHLIYLDLLNGGWSELFERKYEIYGSRYKDEFASALRRITLDIDGDGIPDISRSSFVGYLSR